MYKKTISYKIDDKNIKKDLCFNLTNYEILNTFLDNKKESIEKIINNILNAKGNTKIILENIEKIICESYGEYSKDEKHFYKNKKILYNFISSIDFDILINILLNDEKEIGIFLDNVIPKK